MSKDEIRNINGEFGKDIWEKITLEEFMEIVLPRLPDRHSKEYIQNISIFWFRKYWKNFS